jgi:hypothetical protein
MDAAAHSLNNPRRQFILSAPKLDYSLAWIENFLELKDRLDRLEGKVRGLGIFPLQYFYKPATAIDYVSFYPL